MAERDRDNNKPAAADEANVQRPENAAFIFGSEDQQANGNAPSPATQSNHGLNEPVTTNSSKHENPAEDENIGSSDQTQTDAQLPERNEEPAAISNGNFTSSQDNKAPHFSNAAKNSGFLDEDNTVKPISMTAPRLKEQDKTENKEKSDQKAMDPKPATIKLEKQYLASAGASTLKLPQSNPANFAVTSPKENLSTSLGPIASQFSHTTKNSGLDDKELTQQRARLASRSQFNTDKTDKPQTMTTSNFQVQDNTDITGKSDQEASYPKSMSSNPQEDDTSTLKLTQSKQSELEVVISKADKPLSETTSQLKVQNTTETIETSDQRPLDPRPGTSKPEEQHLVPEAASTLKLAPSKQSEFGAFISKALSKFKVQDQIEKPEKNSQNALEQSPGLSKPEEQHQAPAASILKPTQTKEVEFGADTSNEISTVSQDDKAPRSSNAATNYGLETEEITQQDARVAVIRQSYKDKADKSLPITTANLKIRDEMENKEKRDQRTLDPRPEFSKPEEQHLLSVSASKLKLGQSKQVEFVGVTSREILNAPRSSNAATNYGLETDGKSQEARVAVIRQSYRDKPNEPLPVTVASVKIKDATENKEHTKAATLETEEQYITPTAPSLSQPKLNEFEAAMPQQNLTLSQDSNAPHFSNSNKNNGSQDEISIKQDHDRQEKTPSNNDIIRRKPSHIQLVVEPSYVEPVESPMPIPQPEPQPLAPTPHPEPIPIVPPVPIKPSVNERKSAQKFKPNLKAFPLPFTRNIMGNAEGAETSEPDNANKSVNTDLTFDTSKEFASRSTNTADDETPLHVEPLDLDECFEIAIAVIQKAGAHAMTANKDVSVQDSRDLLARIDSEVEEIIVEAIHKKYPNHKFIYEKEVKNSRLKQVVLTAEPTWAIDPIDGTMNFVHHFPYYCISVALLVNKVPVIGIVFNPPMKNMYTARRGQGAKLNGEPMHASGQEDLEQSLILQEFCSGKNEACAAAVIENSRRLITKAHALRSIGSTALALGMVASGDADGFYYFGLHIWDMAAGILLVTEAGGTVIDPNGGELDLMSRRVLAAATPNLAQNLAQHLTQNYPVPRDDQPDESKVRLRTSDFDTQTDFPDSRESLVTATKKPPRS